MPWTVTNSFKRGLMMKTYGRPVWRVYDDDLSPAAKKRRVQSGNESDEAENSIQYAIRESSAAVLSSPSRRNSILLSEGTQDDDLSTPPSSPPPRLSSPPANTRKPTFAFLKRKQSANKEAGNSSPLTEVNSNSVRPSVDPPKKKATSQQPALKQMQLDLGHEVRRTCATCGMEYVPSNSEDAALHKKFHDMNTTGVDLGKAFMRANASRWVYEATRFDEGYVVIVDRKASPTAKNQAKKVLEVINKELSSPEIQDDVLWSQTEPPRHLRKNGVSEKVDRYKVFLHMKDSRCVGACLTERIWESRPVEKPASQTNRPDSAVTVRNETHPAIVGISRIWTSGSSRRKGIAMDLLDCVVSNFIYGMEIPKEQMAFSQPTESGRALAQSFFGDEEWHVYEES
ncbi:ESCO1/2 acetyl-transferase-domain-containing protein [Aspergillus pseudonomiae]|uniref:Sister chromatid cohesion acetyltransferase Eco1 n=1 Tax=Aspergillus nomiae NRRL (strain ATCC 15546 / NRRL 13137 / CBS 260.88 / M93) TaxID=1509407 RepID=A0A0L1J0F4_ASPN3|nr:sister chromatid cohesion acetyltransferase Eco1 [Aspergillus nomiae NRRL 13137]KAB8254264.1 ESCO1/2 acetyl-transferase-domain-containing protein [Aspergillus pseudonomiae]KNG85227.1 sister chromatid cohesion acetyltransferase Eco1 [Aspergillus nomiae NRRL 13137]